MSPHILRFDGGSECDLYFVDAPAVGLVKIGITNNIAKRLRDLGNGSPVPLRLWCVVRGTALHESALKRAFADENSHGEWFLISDRVRAFVDALGALDAASIRRQLDDLARRFYPQREPTAAPVEVAS